MSRNSAKILPVLISLLGLVTHASATEHKIDQAIDGAVESVYTPRVIDIISCWERIELPAVSDEKDPFWIEGIHTSGSPNYIGLRKRVYIHAPPQQVVGVLEDFGSYPKIFPGVQSVSVRPDANELVTGWVRDRPMFLFPKVIYDQTYVAQDLGGRTFLRYELNSANSMSHSDGVIAVETAPSGTYVSSYDFFEGNFGGVARLLAGKKIWRKSLEGFKRADLALKAKVENPEWDLDQIEKKVDSAMKHDPLRLKNIHFLEAIPTCP